MTYKNIKLERAEPGISIVTISRREALNALNSETLGELTTVLEREATDATTRVVVLTGEGPKSFIAGADISEMAGKSPDEGVAFAHRGHKVAKLLETMPKPTIAAVNGFALGGGTEMAIACDFIVASDNAVFGQPEVGLGIIPGFGATFRLARFVGLPMAKELIFSGRRIKADGALRLGLVNSVHPQAELMPRVLELARTISHQSFSAVAMAKSMINEMAEPSGIDLKIDTEARCFSQLFGSHDQREGMGAFVEKRKPPVPGALNRTSWIVETN